MLEYLLKYDLAIPLRTWADFTILNYLESGTNPLKFLQMNCAPLILEYFRLLVSTQQYEVFSELSLVELQQLLKLPNDMMFQYFELFSEPNDFYFNMKGLLTGNITHIDYMF